MTETKKMYKAHGICCNCGQRDAVRGQTLCPDCKERQHEAYLKWYAKKSDNYKAGKLAKARERYARLKSEGLCTQCGKRKPKEGCSTCARCLDKRNASRRRRSRERGVMPREMFGDGYHCEMCGKETEKGKKLCPPCYEKSVKSIAYARTFITKTGYFYKPWRV